MGDYRTTKGEALPASPRASRRRKRRLLLMIVALLAAVVAAGHLVQVRLHVPAAGYVTGEKYAEVRPAAGGPVARILAFSGDTVEKGDILVRLDDGLPQARLDEANSQVRRVEAEISRLEARMAERQRLRQKALKVTGLRLEHASAKVRLTAELAAKGLASGQALEDQRLGAELARAEHEALLAEDETLQERDMAVLRQELAARRDVVKGLEASLQMRLVRAPLSGVVVRYEFGVGEVVGPEDVLYEVFGGERQVLKLRIPERYSTLTATGQTYRAYLRPYRGLRRVAFRGRIERLRDVIQGRDGKTYRMATCSFEPAGHLVPPGATAEARVCVGRGPLWTYASGLY